MCQEHYVGGNYGTANTILGCFKACSIRTSSLSTRAGAAMLSSLITPRTPCWPGIHFIQRASLRKKLAVKSLLRLAQRLRTSAYFCRVYILSGATIIFDTMVAQIISAPPCVYTWLIQAFLLVQLCKTLILNNRTHKSP